jgi:hypothetical protein
MQLLYDRRDDAYHERVGSQILYWLDDLDALPLDEADPAAAGFLFTGARPIDDYRELVGGRPLVRDRPAEREPLLRLDTVLQTLERAGGCGARSRRSGATQWVGRCEAILSSRLRAGHVDWP